MATPSRMMMPMSPIVSPKPLQDVLMMAIGSRPEHTPISRQPMNSERNGCSLNLMTSAKTTEMDTRKARMSERLPSMKGSCERGWGVRGRTACRGEAGGRGCKGFFAVDVSAGGRGGCASGGRPDENAGEALPAWPAEYAGNAPPADGSGTPGGMEYPPADGAPWFPWGGNRGADRGGKKKSRTFMRDYGLTAIILRAEWTWRPALPAGAGRGAAARGRAAASRWAGRARGRSFRLRRRNTSGPGRCPCPGGPAT